VVLIVVGALTGGASTERGGMPKKDLIDAAKVKVQMAAMVKFSSHPELIAAMKQRKKTPVDKGRSAWAAR
jgi:pyruvate/2-oxoglutarate dehydrogenase complex dihydrolipoamide dehydrogenase (E3) component